MKETFDGWLSGLIGVLRWSRSTTALIYSLLIQGGSGR